MQAVLSCQVYIVLPKLIYEVKETEFSDQIKQLRKENNLSQVQYAKKLYVTRQAVSNWKNNRNLLDLEMLIELNRVCHISLDQLILGDDNMNKMTQKLIKDTDESRKAKYNMITTLIGGFLALFVSLSRLIRQNTLISKAFYTKTSI